MSRSIPLHSFLERIKTIGFLQRVFFWQKIRNELFEAAKSLSRVDTELQNLQVNGTKLNNDLCSHRRDIKRRTEDQAGEMQIKSAG